MLTDQQIGYFHENGYLIVRGCVPADQIEALRTAADALERDAIRRLSSLS